MTKLTESQREMLTGEEKSWFPCSYPANELLCRLAKERESTKDAFLELIEQQSERIKHKNEMIDEVGAACNRNADSLREAVQQHDEAQGKLKRVYLYCANVDSSSEGAAGVAEDILALVEEEKNK